MSILDVICDATRERVNAAKLKTPLSELKAKVADIEIKKGYPFEKALSGSCMSFICECKKASPSKGIIAENYSPVDIAVKYERAGADCLSVLTEPQWFKGSTEHLKAIAKAVSIPCLRKDFTIDEYMIYEAKLLGASAVLLICSALSKNQLSEYLSLTKELGLSALVEAHDENETHIAAELGARIIGVNNRNLADFTVNTDNALSLRASVSPDIIFVAESGVSKPEEVAKLQKSGVNAVLIGEALMRADDKTAKLKELKSLL